MAAKSKDKVLNTRIGVSGETTYREALKKVQDQLRVLNAEMKATTSSFGENANSVEALSAKQKQLSQIQEQHAQKVKYLSEMLQVAKDTFGEASTEANEYRVKLANAQTALNRCTTELDKTSAGLEAAKSAAEGGSEANEQLGDSAEETAEQVKTLGDESEETGEKGSKLASIMAGAGRVLGGVTAAGAKACVAALAAVATAAVAATKAGFDMAQSAGHYADDLGTLSTQTGVSQQSLQQWAYTSNFIDTSLESITGAMAKTTEQMGQVAQGSKEVQAKFSALGVSCKDVHGRLRSNEEVFWDTIDALHNMRNPTERDAMAMQLFGESAQQLNPLIEAGRKGFEALGDEAERLGVVFTDEELATMGGFDDAMNRASQAASGLKNTIGLALIPAFQPLVGRATTAMAQVSAALRDGVDAEEIGQLTKDLLAEAEGAFDDVVDMIDGALPLLSDALGSLLSALAQKLPGLVNRVLPAAMNLLQSVLNALTENAADIGRVAGELVGQLVSFLISNLPALLSAAWQLAQGLMQGLASAIGPCWEAVKGTVSQVMGQIWGAITGAFGSLAGILENVLGLEEGAISGPLNAAMDAVGQYFGQVWEAITGVFGTLGEIVSGVLSGEISVGEALSQAISAVEGYFKQVWDAAAGVFGNLAGILEGVLGLEEGAISGPLNAAISAVTGFFGDIWEAITGVFGTLGGIIKGVLGGEISLGDALGRAIEAVKGCFVKIWDAICSVFGTLGDIVAGLFGESDIGGKAKAAWGDIKDNVVGAFQGVWQDIMGAFGSLGDWFSHIFDDVAGNIQKAWDHLKGGIHDTVTGIWNTITGWFGGEGQGGGTHESDGEQTHGGGTRADVPVNQPSPQPAAATPSSGQTAVIQSIADEALRTASGNITAVSPDVSKAVTDALQAAMDAAGLLMTQEAGTVLGSDWMAGVVTGVTEQQESVTNAAETNIRAALNALNGLVSGGMFNRIGAAISQGIANGIRGGSGAIVAAAKSAAQAAYNAAKQTLDIHSPSRVMRQIGEYYDLGFAQGITRGKYHIVDAARSLSQLAAQTLQTSRGPSIDYGMLGSVTAAALRQQTTGGEGIDYDRLGTAVAQANLDSGVGNAVIEMDKRRMGRTLERDVSAASSSRSSQSIAGRGAKLMTV